MTWLKILAENELLEILPVAGNIAALDVPQGVNVPLAEAGQTVVGDLVLRGRVPSCHVQ